MNIWNDSWIPGPGDGRINCHNIDINYTTVDQLITSRHCTWKEDIVRAITDWDQADCILNIPLTKSKQADTMVGSMRVWVITQSRMVINYHYWTNYEYQMPILVACSKVIALYSIVGFTVTW